MLDVWQRFETSLRDNGYILIGTPSVTQLGGVGCVVHAKGADHIPLYCTALDKEE